MRIVKRTVKWIAITLLSLLLTLGLALTAFGFWIYHHPQAAWSYVKAHHLPADLSITWQDISLHVNRAGSWRRWDVVWDVGGLDVQKGEPRLHVPLETLHLAARFALAGEHWLTVREMIVHAPQPVEYWSEASDQETDYAELLQTVTSSISRVARLAQYIGLETLNVQLKRLVYHAPGRAPLDLAVEVAQGEPSLIRFNVNAGHLTAGAVQDLDLSGQARLQTAQTSVKADLHLTGPKLRAATPLEVELIKDKVSLSAKPTVTYRLGRRDLQGKMQLGATATPEALTAEATADLAHLPGPLVKLSNIRAQMRLPLQDQAAATTFKLTAPLTLFFIDKNMKRPFERSCQCRIPERLIATLAGQAWLKPLLEPNPKEQAVLDAKLNMEGVKNKLFAIDLGAALTIKKKAKDWIFEPRLNSEATVYSYQGLRRFLDAKNIMIPAPLNVLEGQLHLVARGPIGLATVDGENTRANATALFDIDLSSKGQKVRVRTETFVKATPDFHRMDVNVKAHIDQLELELPPLDPIAGLPGLVTDRRLQLEPERPTPAPKGHFKLYLTLSADTAKPDAIKLFNKLADPYVPVSILVDQKNSQLDGQVKVDKFKINYLRRRLHVDHLTLSLAETNDGDFPLNADFHVNQTEYKVMIHIGGTLHSPEIQLSSDPYLGREDIISVLLYDRTNDQLVGGDAETAGNVQAAIADRAIGLFGLWAFATTPIRSFSYNPVTKVYSATVVLGKGLTAGIGTTWEQTANLEVRKRLSRRWVLTASWNPGQDPNQEDSAASQVVLQWEKRF